MGPVVGCSALGLVTGKGRGGREAEESYVRKVKSCFPAGGLGVTEGDWTIIKVWFWGWMLWGCVCVRLG